MWTVLRAAQTNILWAFCHFFPKFCKFSAKTKQHSDHEILSFSADTLNAIDQFNNNFWRRRIRGRHQPHLSAKWHLGKPSSVHKCVFSTKWLTPVQQWEDGLASAACQSMHVVCSGTSPLHISLLYHNGSPRGTEGAAEPTGRWKRRGNSHRLIQIQWNQTTVTAPRTLEVVVGGNSGNTAM